MRSARASSSPRRDAPNHPSAEPWWRRQSPLEWALLAVLVLVPAALAWRFGGPSFYFHDDWVLLFDAHHAELGLDYLTKSANGHLTPGMRSVYMAVDLISPANWELGMGFLIACHAASAVLLQRILQLVFGRTWWTYAVAFAWAVSVIYLVHMTFVASGLLSVPAITATLASIHGYLCFRSTKRTGWLVWSLAAMCLGLAFFIKALLIPVYILLMRVLLLEPDTLLRQSVRNALAEWKVWLAYAAIGVAYVLVYMLGDYQQPRSGAGSGPILDYFRIFWLEGFWPMVAGVRVRPFGHEAWHTAVIVATQLVLAGLVVWSIVRRRSAWRAWAFLLILLVANLLIVVGRVSEYGADTIAYYVRYYAEGGVLVALAFAFAFARPGQGGTARLRLPTRRIAVATAALMAVYLAVTLATTDYMSKPGSIEFGTADSDNARTSGRISRDYVENLRDSLDEARREGPFSLHDHDAPEQVASSFLNLLSYESGIRYSLLSNLTPLIGEDVDFDRVGRNFIVRSDGSLERTRFVRSAGGSVADLVRTGTLKTYVGEVRRTDDEWCLSAGAAGAGLQWLPSKPPAGRDWVLRARYRTAPDQELDLESNWGEQWLDEIHDLPPMPRMDARYFQITDFPLAGQVQAGLRLLVPPEGLLCLGSLEVGYFDPPPPPPVPPPPG